MEISIYSFDGLTLLTRSGENILCRECNDGRYHLEYGRISFFNKGGKQFDYRLVCWNCKFESSATPSEGTWRKIAYQIYLASPEWERLRKKALNRDKKICQGCLGKATEVHHINYPNVFGNELLFDLVSICRECHQKHHEDEKLNNVR